MDITWILVVWTVMLLALAVSLTVADHKLPPYIKVFFRVVGGVMTLITMLVLMQFR